MLVLEGLLLLLIVSACGLSFTCINIKGKQSIVNIMKAKDTFTYIILHCEEGVKFQRIQTDVLSKLQSMATDQPLPLKESGCLGIVCTDLGWKQQSESQSVWPDPVRSTLPFGRPTIFQRRSSLQETRMSLLGCIAILYRERQRALWVGKGKQFPSVNKEISMIAPLQQGSLRIFTQKFPKQTLYPSYNSNSFLIAINLFNSLDLRILIYKMKYLTWVIVHV